MNGLPENLIKRLSACSKHSCQTSFQSEEIWSHNSCTRYASRAFSQKPDWIQNTVDRLRTISCKASTYIQEIFSPSKKKKILHKIQWKCMLKVTKFKHDTFGKGAFAVYGHVAWIFLPKESKGICDEIEAFKQHFKTLNLWMSLLLQFAFEELL